MKRLLVAVLLVGACGVRAHAKPTPEIKALLDKVSPSIVMVVTPRTDENGQPGRYICTGVVVRPAQVLTAKHCVETGEGQALPVTVDDLPARVVKTDAWLALLVVERLQKPPLPLRKEKIAIRQDTFAFGFGRGFPTLLGRPIVWIVNYSGNVEQEDFTVDGLFIAGMSGGPITDADGRLIGIVQSSDSSLGMGFASGPGAIRAFLK